MGKFECERFGRIANVPSMLIRLGVLPCYLYRAALLCDDISEYKNRIDEFHCGRIDLKRVATALE